MHGSIQLTSGLDGYGMCRDVSIHPSSCSDKNGTVALDVSKNTGTHLDVIGHDGIEKMDVASLFDHNAMAAHIANVITARADDEFTRAVDVAGNVAVNSEIPAVDFCGAEVAVFPDQHVAAGADGRGGVHVDLEILQADIYSAGRAVGGFRRAPDFKKMVTVEAFDIFEMMLSIAALLLHFEKGALRGGGRLSYDGVKRRCAPDSSSFGVSGLG